MCRIPWIKGKHHTEETKEKISKAMTGRILSEEHRQNLGEAMKGEKNHNWGKKLPPLTKEHKRKLSKAHKGKHHTEETKKKMSLVKIGSRNYMFGCISPFKNRHHTQETKRKISKALKGRKLTKEQIKNHLRRRIPTLLEKQFQKIIDKHNLPFKYVGNGSFILGNCNPDFININGQKTAIEVYARYYKSIGERDIDKWKQKRIEKFKEYGWNVIFFDETQVNEKFVLEEIAAKGNWS